MHISQSLDSNWTFLDPKSGQSLPAIVPGCIHTDLLRHGLIPDPFWGSNELGLQYLEELDHPYRCEFTVDPTLLSKQHLELVADGLDTITEIFLNGQKVGETENMYSSYRFPVREFLVPGKNSLEILFRSPLPVIRARQSPDDLDSWFDSVGGNFHVRKEPCSFGWDWGPRFVTSGIWLPIRLEGWSEARFDSVKIKQRHQDDQVLLTFDPRILGTLPSPRLSGQVSFNGVQVAEITVSESGQLASTIEHPHLWWPNGHGDQPLYEVKLNLLNANGQRLDTWHRRIGLRTLKLDRHPDEFGETFQFVVNGRVIFAKGANWIPAHSFVTEVSRSLYDNLLTSAVEANMNMIRVWGGGIYENEEFYDLCDEKGLLVWQDFMFACSLYPGNKPFLDLVREEAAYQIRRLSHRACLALWCGNNELEQIPDEILKTPERKKAYEAIFYQILPESVAEFDGITPYWPSSPHNPEGYEKGFINEQAGDSHFWDVWHARKPVKTYEEKKFRFCSEFGMQSYSSPEVAATYCDPKEFNVFGPEMENHQKNLAGNLIIMDYISRRYRFPSNYESLAYLSQLNQAYCLKVGVEHFRRSMPCTMGALYWQLNDCWPVASWSSLEFGGIWKALHYEAKRFFAPALVSIHVQGDEIAGKGNYLKSTIRGADLYTVYDGIKNSSGEIRWTLCLLDGSILQQDCKRVPLLYGESVCQYQLDFSQEIQSHGAHSLYLAVELHTETGEISRQTAFFTAPRNIRLKTGIITHRIEQKKPGVFQVTLCSEVFQHAVQCHFLNLVYRAEDNFFDLYPTIPRSIEVTTAPVLSVEALNHAFQIKSLVETYQR